MRSPTQRHADRKHILSAACFVALSAIATEQRHIHRRGNGISPAGRKLMNASGCGMEVARSGPVVKRGEQMKTLIVFIIALAFLTLGGVSSMALAHSSDDLNLQAAVQSIGSSTRAEITRIGDQGANVSRALSLQAEGDQALRRGELALAAENYGRAREALSVLDRERSLAATERTRAASDLQRAQRDGDDIAWAAAKVSEGNRAFATGNYITSDIDYAEARADLIGG